MLVESEFVFNPQKEKVAKKDRTAPGVNGICAEWEHRQYKNVEFSVVSEDVSDHIGSYRNFEPMLGCYFYKVLREWASENDWKPKFLEHMVPKKEGWKLFFQQWVKYLSLKDIKQHSLGNGIAVISRKLVLITEDLMRLVD